MELGIKVYTKKGKFYAQLLGDDKAYKQKEISEATYYELIFPVVHELDDRKDFKHPELREGEVFLLNVADDEDWNHQDSCITSIRRGEVAYNATGEIVKDLKPLFGTLK